MTGGSCVATRQLNRMKLGFYFLDKKINKKPRKGARARLCEVGLLGQKFRVGGLYLK
jgi:hypothetical protein